MNMERPGSATWVGLILEELKTLMCQGLYYVATYYLKHNNFLYDMYWFHNI